MPQLWPTNPTFRLEWRPLPQGFLAFDLYRGQPLAGLGQNFMRPWVYPLYTPSGHQVLQEFAFDHPFHNGCFIGWHPVRCEGTDHNFWVTPPARSCPDPLLANLGRIQANSPLSLSNPGDTLTADFSLVWRSDQGTALATEYRSFKFWTTDCGHGVDLRSRLQAIDQPLELPSTKFAGIGIRLDPCLTPVCNSWFEGSQGRGSASILHECRSKFLRVESCSSEGVFGLYLEAPGFELPWFVRDYGLILLNPVWHAGRDLAPGEILEQQVRMLAYDAKSTPTIDELSSFVSFLD